MSDLYQIVTLIDQIMNNLFYNIQQRTCISMFQDILNDEDISLDDMFITSLISDLIKVKSFLPVPLLFSL